MDNNTVIFLYSLPRCNDSQLYLFCFPCLEYLAGNMGQLNTSIMPDYYNTYGIVSIDIGTQSK